MAQALQLDFDFRELRKALAEYAAATRKLLPEVTDRAAKNIAMRTVSFMPKAERASIAQLGMSEWWPKFIASKISTGHNIAYYTRTRKKKRRKVFVEGSYKVSEARRVSRRILQARYRSISFMKSGFFKAARGFPGDIRRPIRTADRLTKAIGKGIRASKSRPISFLIVQYIAKKGKAGDARRKERIAVRAFSKGIRFVTKDMKRYAERKAAELAKKHSARR